MLIFLKNIQELSEKEKKEVLNFIEYLRIKEDHSLESVEARRRGDGFISLEELQRDYA